MAELLINVRQSTYDEGDCLVACNQRATHCVHLQHICFPKLPSGRLENMDADGIMPVGHVGQDWYEATHQYRIERISNTQGRLTRISDGVFVEFTTNQTFTHVDGSAAQMDIELFFQRKRAAQQAPVYGTLTREIWYGGHIDVSSSKLSAVWDAVEAKTSHVRTDPQWTLHPWGTQDMKSFLAIPVNEFDDSEANSLVSPKRNGEEVQFKRGRCMNAWRSILAAIGATEADVLNPNVTVDRRNASPLNHVPMFINKPRLP